MRNFKINVLLVLLLSVFSCDTQQISEDEVPNNLNAAGDKYEPITPGNKSGFTMIITVQYPTGWDRAATRASIGPLLGLVSWSPCGRPDAETWIVDIMTEAQLFAILDNFNVSKVSAGSAGANDPFAKDPTVPVFYHENLCD